MRLPWRKNKMHFKKGDDKFVNAVIDASDDEGNCVVVGTVYNRKKVFFKHDGDRECLIIYHDKRTIDGDFINDFDHVKRWKDLTILNHRSNPFNW